MTTAAATGRRAPAEAAALFLALARNGYRRYATYGVATLAGLFTNVIFGILRANVFEAVYRHRPRVGLTLEDTLTYVWLTQALIMVVYLWIHTEIAPRIRSGDIAFDVARPLDFQGYWFARDLGRAVYHTVARALPCYLVGYLLFDLHLPPGAGDAALFTLTVVLGITIMFSIRFLVGLSAFWLIDIRGVQMMTLVAVLFFSGFTLPLQFFPDWLETLSRLLPFAGVSQIPVEFFLGKGELWELALQAAWALALLALGRFVLARGRHKLVIQGG